MAPIEIQKKAGCVIGADYPHPIVDHATAGYLCCEKLRSIMNMVQQAPCRRNNLATSARRTPHRLSNHHGSQHPAAHLQQLLQLGSRNCADSAIPSHHQQRYHPYTQQPLVGGVDACTTMTDRDPLLHEAAEDHSESDDSSLLQRGSKCNFGLGPNPCTICVSTDNLMSQLMCSHTLAQERAKNASYSLHRTRRRTPPSNCSHKLSNFTFIT